MLQFEKRIETLKLKAARKHKRSDLLNEAFKIIDELHAEYQKVWAQECNATMALEGQQELIARLKGGMQQDSFDIDPNNKD
jgi:hypothetical protein